MNEMNGDRLLEDEVKRARNDGVQDGDGLPFLLVPAGAVAAVLLVHGFSATPREMRPLAEKLAEWGYACVAVRLPGHGTSPEDLATRSWEEWLETTVRGYDLLTRHFRRVYGTGMSTGSLLLLALARQRQLPGLVLLSPYLRLRHPLAPVAGWLRHLYPYQQRSLDDDEAGHYYARRPLAGIHQINRLVRTLAPHLGEIAVPVLAIHGEGDETIDIDSGRQLVEGLGSAVKVYERFGPEARHVLTNADNPHRGAIFDLIGKFVGELEDQAGKVECR